MSTPGGPAVQPGMLSASQLTWKLIFINYCLKLLCWALKLARFANNYAVLMMFSALFGSHQQSAIFGCCAGFVWKWHPSLQQTLTRWKLFKGTCKHQFPPSKVCFFQKCAVVYHQLMPHMVGALIWFDSCFRVERCELGQTLQPVRAVVASDYEHEHEHGERREVSALQRWRNSRSKTALRRESWGKLDAQRSRFWQILEVSGLGQREERGEMIL